MLADDPAADLIDIAALATLWLDCANPYDPACAP